MVFILYASQFFDYLQKNNLCTPQFIVDNGLSNIVAPFTKDIAIRSAYVRDKLYNKVANPIILQEISNFVDFFNEHKIKAVFVKGATSVYTVYDNPEDRYSGDIDVYVEQSGIKRFLEFLIKREYFDTTTNELVSTERWETYIGPSTHLTPLARRTTIARITYFICVEIHLCPFFVTSNYNFLQSKGLYVKFYESAIWTDIGGVSVPMLPPVMNFIYMLDHIAKHIYGSLTLNVMEHSINNSIEVEILKLYEAKLYYEKYKNKIPWDEFTHLCHEYNCQYQIELMLAYINELFPNTTDKFIATNGNLPDFLFSENVTCNELKQYKLHEILHQAQETKEQLIEKIYKNHDYTARHISVPKKAIGSCGASFAINHEKSYEHNTSITNIMRGIPFSKDDFSLNGSLSWDEKYFYIAVSVIDKKFPEKNGNILYVHLDNLKNDSALKGFYVRIQGNGRADASGWSYHLVDVADGNRWLENMNEDIVFSYTADDGAGYSFFLALPFEMVNVIPHPGCVLAFDIVLSRHEGYKLVSLSSIGCVRESFARWSCARVELQ